MSDSFESIHDQLEDGDLAWSDLINERVDLFEEMRAVDERASLVTELLAAIVRASLHPLSEKEVLTQATQLLEDACAVCGTRELAKALDVVTYEPSIEVDRARRLYSLRPSLTSSSASRTRAREIAELIAGLEVPYEHRPDLR